MNIFQKGSFNCHLDRVGILVVQPGSATTIRCFWLEMLVMDLVDGKGNGITVTDGNCAWMGANDCHIKTMDKRLIFLISLLALFTPFCFELKSAI